MPLFAIGTTIAVEDIRAEVQRADVERADRGHAGVSAPSRKTMLSCRALIAFGYR
jgi:hypothetical protein